MRRGDAHRRTIEIVEGFVGDDRHDFGAPAAQPRIFLDREQTVGFGDRRENGPGIERHQRTNVDHFAVDAVFAFKRFGSGERARHHQGERDNGAIRTLAHDLGGAERVDDLAVGHFAFGGVERFMFEEDDRIGIAHGSGQQTDDIERRRGSHDLQARNHHAPVLNALGMLRAEARAGAIAGAHHQRAFGLAVRHITALGEFVGDIIETDREEIRKHDFRDRLQAGHRRAHGGAEDRLFGDRRVAHAQRAKLFVQPDRRLEHAAGFGDILAEEHDIVVARHFLRDAANDRVAIANFRHAKVHSL